MPNTYVRKPENRKVQKGPHRFRVRVPAWVDPFFGIQGSSIEKMVLAEFVRRGIYFEHTPQANPVFPQGTMLNGVDLHTWEPDFLLPQYKIWIEIQGGYFHTQPGAILADSIRFAIIEAAGWRPIYWWEDDIRTRLQDLMNAVPEFYRVEQARQRGLKLTPGLKFYEGGTGIDHLKGLRKALANRARPPQNLTVKRRAVRRPK